MRSLKNELRDPLALLGKKISSRHCRDKKETIFALMPLLQGGLFIEFKSKCSCGSTLFRYAGTESYHAEFTKYYIREFDRLLKEPQRRNSVKKVEKFLNVKAWRKWRGTHQIKTFGEFLNHGWFYAKDVKLIQADLRKEINLNLSS